MGAYLFEINGKAVFPKETTLLLSPFKDIWERDESKDKEIAIMEFGYIEFMTSMLNSNPYREYPDEKRHDVLMHEYIINKDWEPDELVNKGMEFIINKQMEGSVTYRYWMSNKAAIEKMIDFFNNFDIDERNPKTFMPIYKPKDITSAVTDAEKTLTTVDALKKKVEEELYESNKMRSGKVVSPFANPDSLRK